MTNQESENVVESPAPEQEAAEGRDGGRSLDQIMDISMPVVIEIGRAEMTIQEVLRLGTGSIIQLDRAVGEPVDVFVGDRKLARGEVVVVGDSFGVRITHLLGASENEVTG